MKVILATIETGVDLNKGGPTGIITKILLASNTSGNSFDYIPCFSINNDLKSCQKNTNSNERSSLTRVAFVLQKTFIYKYIFLAYVALKTYINFSYFFSTKSTGRAQILDGDAYVFHMHDILSAFILLKLYRRKVAGRHLVSLHGVGAYYKQLGFNYLFSSIIKYAECYVLLNSDTITFPSKAALNLYIQDFSNNRKVSDRLHSNKVKVVYNGIDSDNIDRLLDLKTQDEQRKLIGARAGDTIVIIVANYIHSKGVDLIPDLAKELGRNVKFYIVGEGNLEQKLRSEIDSQGITNMFLLPKMDRKSLLNLIKVSDIFLMPSRYTVFDLVMLETMYLQGPIMLASDISGHDEMITHKYDGFLSEHNHFADQLKQLITMDISSKVEVLENAKNTVLKKFTMEKMKKTYEEYYLQ